MYQCCYLSPIYCFTFICLIFNLSLAIDEVFSLISMKKVYVILGIQVLLLMLNKFK